jgi:hypothetical protein
MKGMPKGIKIMPNRRSGIMGGIIYSADFQHYATFRLRLKVTRGATEVVQATSRKTSLIPGLGGDLAVAVCVV